MKKQAEINKFNNLFVRLKSSANGITLIALVITIIVMMILAGVSLNATIGNNGIITQAIKSSFVQEMKALEEAVKIRRTSKLMEDLKANPDVIMFERSVTGAEAEKFPQTLLAEIYFTRNGMCGGTAGTSELIKDKTNRIILENFSLNEENFTNKLFFVDEDLVPGKAETYVYDSETKITYKINGTNLLGETLHSLVYYNMIVNGDMSWVEGGLVTSVETDKLISTLADGSVVYSKPYEPDLNGFTVSKATMVYYNKAGDTKFLSMQDYITLNKPRMIDAGGTVVQEGSQNDLTYYLYDYPNEIWANVRSIGTNEKGAQIETWWTWIPRYAYKLQADNSTEVIFIDINGKYVDPTTGEEKTLLDEDGYTVHEAFSQNGELEGIWASKYPPSEAEESNKTIAPDFTDFADATEIVAFADDGKYIRIPIEKYNELFSGVAEDDYSIRTVKISGTISGGTKDSVGTDVTDAVDASRITVDGEGIEFYIYNYSKQIWANAIMKNNGVESWWVWIPRYAYYLDGNKTEIIFIDTNNQPVDENMVRVPSFYTIHEAFNQNNNKMKGLWVSKYEPSYLDNTDPYSKTTNLANEMNLNDTTAVSASKVSISEAIGNASYFKLQYYSEDGRTESVGNDLSDISLLGTEGNYSIPDDLKVRGETQYYTRYDAGIYPRILLYNENGQYTSTYTWYPRYATRTVTENSGTLRIDRIYVTTDNLPVDTETYTSGLPSGFTVDTETFTDGMSGYWK